MAAEGKGLGRKSSEQRLKGEGAGISAKNTKHERREDAGTREKALEEKITEMEGQKSEGGREGERKKKTEGRVEKIRGEEGERKE